MTIHTPLRVISRALSAHSLPPHPGGEDYIRAIREFVYGTLRKQLGHDAEPTRVASSGGFLAAADATVPAIIGVRGDAALLQSETR